MNDHVQIIAGEAPQIEPPLPHPAEKAPKIWGLWGTLGWGLGAFAVLAAGQFGALLAVLLVQQLHRPGIRIDLNGLGSNGPLIAIVTIASVPLLVGFLYVAIRISRTPFRDYLALHWPGRKEAIIGLLGLFAVLAFESLSATALGQNTPSFMTDTYATGRAAGLLPLLFVAFAIGAPVGEETLFRGFLYRGFAQKLGPLVAIVLTSVAWAVMHIQYDWFFIGQILILGFYLGWVRWKFESTALTIALHATVNSIALLGLALGGT